MPRCFLAKKRAVDISSNLYEKDGRWRKNSTATERITQSRRFGGYESTEDDLCIKEEACDRLVIDDSPSATPPPPSPDNSCHQDDGDSVGGSLCNTPPSSPPQSPAACVTDEEMTASSKYKVCVIPSPPRGYTLQVPRAPRIAYRGAIPKSDITKNALFNSNAVTVGQRQPRISRDRQQQTVSRDRQQQLKVSCDRQQQLIVSPDQQQLIPSYDSQQLTSTANYKAVSAESIKYDIDNAERQLADVDEVDIKQEVESDECQFNGSYSGVYANRTEAEREAAHDLLELANTLPPINENNNIQPLSNNLQPLNNTTTLNNIQQQVNKAQIINLTTINNNTCNILPYHSNTNATNAISNQEYTPLTPLLNGGCNYENIQPLQLQLQQPQHVVTAGTVYLQSPPPSPDEMTPSYTTLIYITPQTKTEYRLPLTPPITEYDSNANAVPKGEPMLTSIISPSFQPHSPLLSMGQDNAAMIKLPIADGRTKRRTSGVCSGVEPLSGGGADRQKYSCSECGKDYATSSNLSRHKQTHRSLDSGNAKQCHICKKLYVSMPALSMHILTHNLSHRCDICGKAFSRPWLLQGHQRSHTGDKPYSCSFCLKSFADRSNLRAHMQTHSTSKNFKCTTCNKTFALKSYLNKHQESVCTRLANMG